MSTAQAPAPTITNAGTKPATPRKLFVNIPVADVQRAIVFFEALGFTFNVQFTDASATSMLVGEDAYFMLRTKERFTDFSKRPLADPQRETGALYALGVESRAAVDEMVKKAVASGGAHAAEPQDHGFMYGWSSYDPDGHPWEVFWMDPKAVQG
jgi:predicted lactoylglutathione lyase